MTDDALTHASKLFPLYRRSHFEYIQFCERGAKALLAPESDLDFREFELAAARLEGTISELQRLSRDTREANQRLTEGLQREDSHGPLPGRQGTPQRASDRREMSG